MSALFGPAGNSTDFADKGYKSNIDAPEYVAGLGLDIYEYQCGRGVRVSMDVAARFREQATKYGIQVSLHAPYYISLSSIEPEKRDKSIEYILQSARAVDLLGGRRIIIHSGSCAKLSRELALEYAIDTMKKAVKALDENGLSHIIMCPETMGKINQLGTVDEVIALCQTDERITPCIDFGHVNAREQGALNTPQAYADILDKIENNLGNERLQHFHSHFSKIEYTEGGEKRHLTFEDTLYGPDFEPLMELVAKKQLSPVFICESDGTQGVDALRMKEYYEKITCN